MSSVKHDVVCANLFYDLLIANAERLIARVKPGGALVLAGILIHNLLKCRRHLRREGCVCTVRNAKVSGVVAGLFRRTDNPMTVGLSVAFYSLSIWIERQTPSTANLVFKVTEYMPFGEGHGDNDHHRMLDV